MDTLILLQSQTESIQYFIMTNTIFRIPFIRLSTFYSIPSIEKCCFFFFKSEWVLDFIKFFYCVYLNDLMFFLLYSVKELYCFAMIKIILEINPNSSLYILNLYDCIQFNSNMLRIFVPLLFSGISF